MSTSTSEPMSVPSPPREPVEGRCKACGNEALRRYPVLSEGGWFMVVKCQECLTSDSREAWNRLGYVVRLEDTL